MWSAKQPTPDQSACWVRGGLNVFFSNVHFISEQVLNNLGIRMHSKFWQCLWLLLSTGSPAKGNRAPANKLLWFVKTCSIKMWNMMLWLVQSLAPLYSLSHILHAQLHFVSLSVCLSCLLFLVSAFAILLASDHYWLSCIGPQKQDIWHCFLLALSVLDNREVGLPWTCSGPQCSVNWFFMSNYLPQWCCSLLEEQCRTMVSLSIKR